MEARLLGLIRAEVGEAPSSRAEVLALHGPLLSALSLPGDDPDALCARIAPKVIHIAGTKGKGSTAAFVESILRASGLRTGLYTSPHLVHVRERFRVNGKPISEEELERDFNHVHQVLQQQGPLPGFFSFLTILGFYVFSRMQLDVVVLEVGLGGRLDATNLIGGPAVCAITLLDMDHTEILGDTIEKIAAEKAGIMKSGVPVLVCEGQQPGALAVLEQKAKDVGSASFEVVPHLPRNRYKLGLAGKYQLVNAGLAVAICRRVFLERFVDEAIVSRGLADCRWPGRSQRIVHSEKLELFLDGAHTPLSLESALEWIVDEFQSDPKQRRSVLLFHCMHSRDPLALFARFRKVAQQLKFDKVHFAPSLFSKPTQVKMKTVAELLGNETRNALDAQKFHQLQREEEQTWSHVLNEVWKNMLPEMGPSKSHISLKQALVEIEAESVASDSGTRLFVTGSILLVGDVMKLMSLPVV